MPRGARVRHPGPADTAGPLRRLVLALPVIACTAGALLAPAPADAASREQAVASALAEARGQGRVLGVTRERGPDGRDVWAVKVIVDGRVRVHRVPAD